MPRRQPESDSSRARLLDHAPAGYRQEMNTFMGLPYSAKWLGPSDSPDCRCCKRLRGRNRQKLRREETRSSEEKLRAAKIKVEHLVNAASQAVAERRYAERT